MTRLHLTPADRRDLLDHVRRSPDPAVRLRSHILLLLADGHPWAPIAAVLREDDRVSVGRETVRLWRRMTGLVWRRPRPVIRPKDPDREETLSALRALLRGLPADETAVFMDEADVNLNPKVGCMWMRRGQHTLRTHF